MTRYSRILLIVAVLMLLGGMVLVTGCSEDDPVTPKPLPELGYLAVSPDSLMSLWETALSSMDSTMYRDVIHPDFQFHFSARDINNFLLLTDHMTGDETVQTAWNMFSGENVTNWQDVVVGGVTRISFPYMTQETPWEVLAAGSENETASARFLLQMFVEKGSGVPILAATGLFDFVALKDDTTNADGSAAQYFRLIDMTEVEPTGKSSETNTWGGIHLTYLVNEAPEAALLVTDIGGTPLPLFQCDASGSQDLDSGLLPEGYRWQFEIGGRWTFWSADAVTTVDYLEMGPKTITVEVRDRWGARATASQTVNVPYPDLPFPSSPDILMSNFQTIYETRYFEGYGELMDQNFLTILQESTSEEFPLIGTTLDVNEELIIHEGMFSGEPLTNQRGDFVPGVSGISFSRFRAPDAWAVSPADDIIPNAEWALFEVDFMFDRGQSYSTLKVEGAIKFYVTSRDSLHEGTTMKYYQMIGQVDLTNLGKAVEGNSWGSVKAMFR